MSKKQNKKQINGLENKPLIFYVSIRFSYSRQILISLSFLSISHWSNALALFERLEKQNVILISAFLPYLACGKIGLL